MRSEDLAEERSGSSERETAQVCLTYLMNRYYAP